MVIEVLEGDSRRVLETLEASWIRGAWTSGEKKHGSLARIRLQDELDEGDGFT